MQLIPGITTYHANINENPAGFLPGIRHEIDEYLVRNQLSKFKLFETAGYRVTINRGDKGHPGSINVYGPNGESIAKYTPIR